MKDIEILNRKASYLYNFIQTYEAGILLSGPEVKSIKAGNANMSDAYCIVEHGEVWIKNLNINPYKQRAESDYNPKQNRKLLLNKEEIRIIESPLRREIVIPLFDTKNPVHETS